MIFTTPFDNDDSTIWEENRAWDRTIRGLLRKLPGEEWQEGRKWRPRKSQETIAALAKIFTFPYSTPFEICATPGVLAQKKIKRITRTHIHVHTRAHAQERRSSKIIIRAFPESRRARLRFQANWFLHLHPSRRSRAGSFRLDTNEPSLLVLTTWCRRFLTRSSQTARTSSPGRYSTAVAADHDSTVTTCRSATRRRRRRCRRWRYGRSCVSRVQ